MKLQEVKTQLAKMAIKIRTSKLMRLDPKNYPGYVPGLEELRADYRYIHTAYCMAQGTPYEIIEPNVAEGNELNTDYLAKLINNIEMPEKVVEVKNA